VVLYELLAGVLPFEEESFARAGLAEIQRTIRRRSRLRQASPDELGRKAKTIAAAGARRLSACPSSRIASSNAIPLKAMRKDRCRRYRSASEMADDIRNYLTGLPLIAGPETTIYRVQKFRPKNTPAPWLQLRSCR